MSTALILAKEEMDTNQELFAMIAMLIFFLVLVWLFTRKRK